MEWMAENWEWVLLAFTIVEKIVKLSPTKYDDMLFDMILKPIFEKVKMR